MVKSSVKQLLDEKAKQYNTTLFISSDPISIPRKFTQLQDIEIMGFMAATLAWGQRITILNNCHKLIDLMGGKPHDFVLHFKEKDLQ